jgi:hypothetical protein
MKKNILFTIFILFSTLSFCQSSTKILGIWQAKLNGKNMLGKDFGLKGAKGAYSVFAVYSSTNFYLIFTLNKTQITKVNIKNILNRQEGAKGTYAVYDSLSQMPEDLMVKFKDSNPYTDNTFYTEAIVDGSPFSFYYNPETKRLQGLNKEILFELVRVGPSW